MTGLQYVLLSSICLSITYIIYLLLFRNEGNFKQVRIYFLISITISILIPLNSFQLNKKFIKEISLFEFSLSNNKTVIDESATTNTYLNEDKSSFSLFFEENWKPLSKTIYLFVAILLISRLIIHIITLYVTYLKSDKKKNGRFIIIYTKRPTNTFSFFNWIFISKNKKSTPDTEKIIIHEKIHASQYHSIDLIMFELLSAVMWFNPLIWMMRKSMQLVHEYLADEGALSTGIDRLKYQALLLNHVTEEKLVSISSSFNHSLIKKRMIMISKSKFKQKTKLKILVLIPVTSILILGVAFAKGQSGATEPIYQETNKQTTSFDNKDDLKSLKIGKIQWKGNTVFTEAILNKAFTLKAGDKYLKDDVNKLIWENENCIAHMYYDKGYVFLDVEVKERIVNKIVDLNINIVEGPRGKTGKITIVGNKKIQTKEILKAIKIKPGSWFNKTQIIESIIALQEMNKFAPDEIIPIPTPTRNEEENSAKIDIEFQVTEL